MASQDPETAFPKGQEHVEEQDDVKVGHRATKQRTAALLAVVSLILLAEAIYRIMNVAQTRSGRWGQHDHIFAPIVLLLAGIFELIFSSLGLLLGLGCILFDFESKMLTTALLGIQLVLGAFTYVVFTIAFPAYRIHYSRGFGSTATAASVFGWIITAIGYDALAQAGQFFLTLQLFNLQGSVSRLGSQYFKLRLMLLSALVFLAGLGVFITGVIVRHLHRNDMQKAAATSLWFPGMSIPQFGVAGLRYRNFGPVFGDINAVRFPAITIVSGILEMIFGVIGLLTAGNAAMFTAFFGFGAFLWFWLMGAHVIAQFGLVPMVVLAQLGFSPWAVQAVITMLLSTSLIMVPLYYAKEAHRSRDH